MAQTSLRVSLEDGSSADVATTAAVMHQNGSCTEENNLLLPTATNTGAIPLRPASVTRVLEGSHTPSNRARPIGDKKSELSSPEINPNQRDLAHQATLRRLNGVTSNHRRVPETSESSPSSSTIEPVLVCSYPKPSPLNGPARKTKMRNNRRSRIDEKSCELPPPERFSFQDILASIDSDVKGSIDAIAEICGRSRMSLADQYGSHLPPLGELTALVEHSDAQEASPGAHPMSQPESSSASQLRPNHNQHQDRRNSASLYLVGNLHPQRSVALSAPVVATSNISSQPIPNSSTHEHMTANNSPIDPHSALLPHVLSWLRRSGVSFTLGGEVARSDEGDHNSAADALQRILTRTREPPPPASVI
jgi:hypothetical protein